MSQQILLPGFEPEPTLTDRLFFAVLPDAVARQRIGAVLADLRAAHGLQARPVMADCLHVTMGMVGDFPGIPGNLLARASHAAQEVVPAVAPFTVSFDTVLTFATRSRASGRRPLVLGGGEGVAGLHKLYGVLTQALRKAGIPGNPPNFTPHLTLMYDQLTVAEQAVDPVAWTVSELVLLHSHIGQNLPYAALGRWPLQG
jgi:2'-5' RNA ligase